METQVLTTHLPRRLAKKVDELAARLERSHEWIVTQALMSWIEQEEKRWRLTLEGLADVDAGRMVDEADVQAWAESLGTDEELPIPQPG